ncbi:pentapeptide repeat-containing protein [Okeania sp. KiyG1]|uniref:pentapeptide repeat-containing protein n=1 Tax=Okeania sp. KiyG1 TaxID=2720165 RepID=UPI00192426E4|nr:pentapeptide repeat-containing protein [Okeania sp. KiyG1]GGA35792.1 hypothetical protein CYANOKiyG1_53460 [Okeania sp. KiyG1]
MDAEELLKRYADGERDFSGIKLTRSKLRGANLKGINLSHATLTEVKLQGASAT